MAYPTPLLFWIQNREMHFRNYNTKHNIQNMCNTRHPAAIIQRSESWLVGLGYYIFHIIFVLCLALLYFTKSIAILFLLQRTYHGYLENNKYSRVQNFDIWVYFIPCILPAAEIYLKHNQAHYDYNSYLLNIFNILCCIFHSVFTCFTFFFSVLFLFSQTLSHLGSLQRLHLYYLSAKGYMFDRWGRFLSSAWFDQYATPLGIWYCTII